MGHLFLLVLAYGQHESPPWPKCTGQEQEEEEQEEEGRGLPSRGRPIGSIRNVWQPK